jgi:hypothetical protein
MDCSKLSTASNSCCYYKTANGAKHCTWWGSKIKGTKTKDDGLTYHYDNPRGSTCGDTLPTLPNLASDCSGFGAPINSCCLGVLAGAKGCYWWAEHYEGTTTYNGMTITCASGVIMSQS